MIIEDFVMLGTTVPEPNSDGRVFVCSAGASEEYQGLVRIYPLARRNAPHRWGVHKVQLERNPQDNRRESFKIAGDRRPGSHQWINYKFEVVKKVYSPNARASFLSRYAIGSIREANEKRLSLAIIHPDEIELAFDDNRASSDPPQLTLFDAGESTGESGARRFRWMPRLRFWDECGRHNLMLRDWGVFEFQRKNEEKYFLENLQGALHLSASSSLLVGNMNNQRTTWLVISVLNGIREPETLFDAAMTDRSAINQKLRRDVYQRDGWKCVRCGRRDQISVEPRLNVSMHSKAFTSEELETVCRSCILGGNSR
jgi:hypothetical protein